MYGYINHSGKSGSSSGGGWDGGFLNSATANAFSKTGSKQNPENFKGMPMPPKGKGASQLLVRSNNNIKGPANGCYTGNNWNTVESAGPPSGKMSSSPNWKVPTAAANTNIKGAAPYGNYPSKGKQLIDRSAPAWMTTSVSDQAGIVENPLVQNLGAAWLAKTKNNTTGTNAASSSGSAASSSSGPAASSTNVNPHLAKCILQNHRFNFPVFQSRYFEY